MQDSCASPCEDGSWKQKRLRSASRLATQIENCLWISDAGGEPEPSMLSATEGESEQDARADDFISQAGRACRDVVSVIPSSSEILLMSRGTPRRILMSWKTYVLTMIGT